ncbi:unnamed protein product [Sympodiomycopsis kandeliae]
MADGKTEWPQQLKDFANRVFSSCTDSNRRIVSEELRKVIFDAFQAGTIYTTDWQNVHLPSLGPPPGSSGSVLSSSSTKKGKKRLISADSTQPFSSNSSSSASAQEPTSGMSPYGDADQDKKEKRARRFENEQRRYKEEQERGWSDAIGSTSLAGRFGGAGPSMPSSSSLANSQPSSSSSKKQRGGRNKNKNAPVAENPGWTYDPMPSFAAPGTPSHHQLPSTGWGPKAVDESIADPNVIDWDRDTVVGLSTKLEKPYLRLTSAPDPKTVRPLPILQQTLELLKTKWRSENNYAYICDQFKSMRQDLTVQRIKNDFTVKVYEIHARIALEKGDLGEYNQCQSQLKSLYNYGLPGSQMEFLAYRILYLLHTRNRREVSALMAELTPSSKSDGAVSHALNVRLALTTGNYHSFFKLFLDAPNMNAYIMDHFIERERVVALSILARSYRPSLPLSYIKNELAFTDETEANEFLKAHSIAIYIDPTPAEAAAAAVANGSNKGKKNGANVNNLPPLEQRKWDCKNALPGIVAAGEKYRKVDIKGQI